MLLLSEQVMSLLRGLIYGKWYDAPAGDYEQIFPLSVDDSGVLDVDVTNANLDVTVQNTGLTITTVMTQTITTGAVTVWWDWFDTAAYKGFGFFVKNKGAVGNVANVSVLYSNEAGGVGHQSDILTIAYSITPGGVKYFDWMFTTTYLNQPNQWHPFFGRSMRLGCHASGSVNDVELVVLGANWV